MMTPTYDLGSPSTSSMTVPNMVVPPLRTDSPPPNVSPVPAINACPELSRCLSTSSSPSIGSGGELMSPESLNSDAFSRRSSASYNSGLSDVFLSSPRHSTYSFEGSTRGRRRGYVRPQGTDFAASARSRESVVSLGSIAHLQYYFARTGLLDGKGAQLARKKTQAQQKNNNSVTSPVDSFASPKIITVEYDSDLGTDPHNVVESPINHDENYFSDDISDSDPAMLPPTVSTYNHRVKQVPPPPTAEELKEQLTASLNNLTASLSEARALIDGTHDQQQSRQRNPTWYEFQGVHILDVATLAIRAAKIYYTAHEQPERLAIIRPEKELRVELLAVMEVLQRMAARGFIGGMRADEIASVESWIHSVHDLLQKDNQAVASDRAERANWLWAKPDWASNDVDRELAFIESMMDLTVDDEPLPAWVSTEGATEFPTPFLACFRNGLRLVKLHNAAVRKSRRRFGAIPMYHTDTMKPYRCADNLRYWVKAAELRWEIMLKIDPLGIVYNTGPNVWIDFEAAILKWCKGVREEMTAELEV